MAVNATDYEQIAPELPESQAEPPSTLPQLHEINDLRDDRRVLGAFRGVVLISDHQQVRDNGRDVEGVVNELDEIDRVPGLAAAIDDVIGTPISLYHINRLNQRILTYYREHDRPVSEVYAAGNQDVSNGVVQIVVLLGRLGEVKLEGAQHFNADRLLERYVSQPSGQPLSMRAVQRDLRGLNSNPFRQVAVAVERGAGFKEANLVYKVTDRKPWRYYAGVDDTGTSVTGKQRNFVGLNWGNVGGWDHVLGYQYTAANNAKDFAAHALSYQLPGWQAGHQWRVFASYSDSNSQPIRLFNVAADNVQLGAQYYMPMAWSDRHEQAWLWGIDFKRSNNDLSFGGTQVNQNAVDIAQFKAAYELAYRQRPLQHRLRAQWVFSPGDITPDNDDRAFNRSLAQADAHYHYWTLDYQLQAALTERLHWRMKLAGQYTQDTLLSAERHAIGGHSSVRGYDEFAALGDRGLTMNQELWWRSSFKLPGELNYLLFVDGGRVESVSAGGVTLASGGLGMRYQYLDYVNLRADYAWQARSLAGRTRGDRVHFRVTISY